MLHLSKQTHAFSCRVDVAILTTRDYKSINASSEGSRESRSDSIYL